MSLERRARGPASGSYAGKVGDREGRAPAVIRYDYPVFLVNLGADSVFGCVVATDLEMVERDPDRIIHYFSAEMMRRARHSGEVVLPDMNEPEHSLHRVELRLAYREKGHNSADGLTRP